MHYLVNVNFENSLLYYFSATPQVVGALVGLLGVFLLFKFQSLNKSIIGFGEQILLHLNNEPFLVTIDDSSIRFLKFHLNNGIIRQDQETVVSQIAAINSRLDQLNNETHFTEHENLQIKNERNGLVQTFKICENIQWRCLAFKYNLIRDSKKLLANCMGVIIFSLISLPLVPLLIQTENKILLFAISLLVLFWFVFCLIKMLWIFIISLSHDYNDGLMPDKKGLIAEMINIFKWRKKVEYKNRWEI